MDELLTIENLTVAFDTDEGVLTAVDDVSLSIGKGESVGLVGESGCGKSVTALSTLRLIPSPPGRIVSGRARYGAEDLLSVPIERLRAVRGAGIGMIFQEPMTALSPLHRVGKQLVEALRLHGRPSEAEAWATGADWLAKMGIADAAEVMYAYPFQLSGGMRQRVMIAMTLMLGPDLIIADEPTTALDVTIQAQIFELIAQMRARETALLLITHDMGVIWEMCERVIVMYASRIVEQGTREQIFEDPKHPYTEALLLSMPALAGGKGRLPAIKGQVPSPLEYPAGCRFADRCKHAFERCRTEQPPLYALAGGRRSACFLAEAGAAGSRKSEVGNRK